MKKLADGKEVSGRIYYYLLDFNEKDEWRTIMQLFSCQQLNQLNSYQFAELFSHAFAKDIEKLKS